MVLAWCDHYPILTYFNIFWHSYCIIYVKIIYITLLRIFNIINSDINKIIIIFAYIKDKRYERAI